jgi:hypothetical protein
MPHAVRRRRVSFAILIGRVAAIGLMLLALTPPPTMAQARPHSYSAAGTHQCSERRSCVVSGSFFRNCIEASEILRTRDCCPSSRGGTSVGFSLNYCIAGN